jgi:hypothetical protein
VRCGAWQITKVQKPAKQFFPHVIITFHREVSESTTYDIYSNLRSVEDVRSLPAHSTSAFLESFPVTHDDW